MDMATIASLLTISSPLSLSFQSSFHLSLTVLVRYRSLAIIYLALDVFYHPRIKIFKVLIMFLRVALPNNSTL